MMRFDQTWWIFAGVLVILAWSRRAAGADAQPGADATPDDEATPATSALSIEAFARAISVAEGFPVAGTAPARAHNPGAIKVPGWTGMTTGAEGISMFGSDADGWAALYRQLERIRDGRSSVYDPSDSILEMAQKWTDTDGATWASNVVHDLQRQGFDYVTEHTQLGDVL